MKNTIKNLFYQTVKELLQLFNFSRNYIKNPQEEIQQLPVISWPTLLITHAALVLTASLFAGLSHLSFFYFMIALFVISSTHTFSLLIGGSLIYFLFDLLYKRKIEFKLMMTLVLFASIPVLLFTPFSNHSYFFFILGGIMSFALLVTGCQFYFKTTTKQALKVSLIPFLIFFGLKLSSNLLSDFKRFSKNSQPSMEKTLDSLEKELRN